MTKFTESSARGSACSTSINKSLKPTFNSLDSIEEIDRHVQQMNKNPRAFPINVFPKCIQNIVRQTNETLGYPIDFISGALLFVAAAAIGNTHKLKFKTDWIESVIIWIVLLGGRGTNKSAPPKWALKPIEQLDHKNYESYLKEMNEYNEKLLLFKKGDCEQPEKPSLKKVIVSDYTPEALYNVHACNKRGLALYIDEFAGFFKNFNRYNSGSEQEAWLSKWNGSSVVKDRVSKEPLRLINPCIPMCGTAQPAILDGLGKDNRAENGFTDRLLFINPEDLTPPAWTDDDIDPKIAFDWQCIVEKLLELDFSTDSLNNQTPHLLSLTQEARKRILQWQRENRDCDLALGSDTVNGISAKIQTYVLRFSLIIQLLRWASGEADKYAVDAESAESAIALGEYFKRTAIEVANYINSKNPLDRLPAYKQELYKKLKPEFKLSEGLATVAENGGLKERAFKEWVDDPIYFKRIGHGVYQKVIPV